MKKRSITLSLAAVLLATSLTACDESAQNSQLQTSSTIAPATAYPV